MLATLGKIQSTKRRIERFRVRRARGPDAGKSYQPQGALKRLWGPLGTETLISGPTGTGKTRAELQWAHETLLKYPRARGLLLRKTRASLSESAMFTFEEYVLGPNHPWVTNGPQRSHRQKYVYDNGSELVMGGLDQSSKFMSTEYDFIIVIEATELVEKDWEDLKTRARLGSMTGRMILDGIIGDCNPDAPTHWLKRREAEGVLEVIYSEHEDNPNLYDAELGELRPAGREMLRRLDQLTGVRLQRNRYGKWVAAEGVVYESYSRGVHVVQRFTPPNDWRKFRVVDFGYTNPFVCHWWTIDPDGRMYRYREIYHTQRIVEDHAKQIKELTSGERIEATVCDHDAEDRATLERHGIKTIGARKEVKLGIQAVEARLRPAGDGRPRMFFMADSLVEIDDELKGAGKPFTTEQEFESYVWAHTSDGRRKEEPVKKDDHGCDTTRYAVMYADGHKQTKGRGGII